MEKKNITARIRFILFLIDFFSSKKEFVVVFDEKNSEMIWNIDCKHMLFYIEYKEVKHLDIKFNIKDKKLYVNTLI